MKLTRATPLRNVRFAYTSKPFKKGQMGEVHYVTEGRKTIAKISVHPKLSNTQKLFVTVHEAVHVAYPDLSEAQVTSGAFLIADVMLKAGFRKV